MVTRVDRKPIIYNTTLIRVLKPAIVASNKRLIEKILSVSAGFNVPDVSARQLIDDYDDIEYGYKIFGVDDPACYSTGLFGDADDDESIRIARMCLAKGKTPRQLFRNAALMEDLCKFQNTLFEQVQRVYYGTEAVYQVYNQCLMGAMFKPRSTPNYTNWATETAKRVLLFQSTYLLIHPMAVHDMAVGMCKDMDYRVWAAWDVFKQLETVAMRIGSRKGMFAHAYYAGINRKGFTPSDDPLDDFKLPLTGYSECLEHVSLHAILGLRYFTFGNMMCVLSHDDCVNLATMGQCYFRTAMYFTKSNGYGARVIQQATTLLRDIASHCCRLIDANKNFSHIIRSMHVLSQGEFNDMFEALIGTDLGWAERSENYKQEAHSLDPMGEVFHKRAVALAVDNIDKLNTCFIYHAFIGDEMLLDDLRNKVKDMDKKVRKADSAEWALFMKFVKAYTLCRYMMVNKKKPRCAGDISLLNSKWAERCVGGTFTMPPQSDWGKVWIFKEMRYAEFADTWHLEAQDVAYVMKDSSGLLSAKYTSDRKCHSELLMAMAHGNILDPISRSTPASARERIINNRPVTEVVLTTAPKAENAKPSWKKRVTFAADCEFRKMQAEFDRNTRKIMSFVRGPSLGVDQCILEKQFADICNATSTGLNGAVCSHDISAWSESMDRGRKFEFEQLLIGMFDRPEMINIKEDWQKINAVVSKQGCKDLVKIDNGSFQGFDGSSSTILHSMILIYCIDSARRKGIMPVSVKTNMATLIDDCIAFMVDLTKQSEAVAFWAHLKETYAKLGFEVDDLKSIFSTIKAIYLSRRFILGGEVPADLKVYIKAHSSYEDPLRCTLDVPGDIFGAMRGACDANGSAWYIYYTSCVSVLAELAHAHNTIMNIAPAAAAVFALAPVAENGWGFPSIMDWATNDITDKRSHFNAMLEQNAVHACQSEAFTRGIDVYPRTAAKAIHCIKSQAWRLVSYSNIFTNPFEAIREGPLKPDMLRRNAIQDILSDVAIADPWKALLSWNTNITTTRVREMLIQSGPLHAPTLAALVNCMPDNYRLSMIGKAMGSDSLLSLLDNAQKTVLRRRVQKCSSAYFEYSRACYESSNITFDKEDMACLTYAERTRMEREEFYTANGVVMTDHTFPDPVSTFTVSSITTNSVISPNLSSLRAWDKTLPSVHRTSQFISDKGMYVPRKSGRVWEVTCEHAKGWDSVSQRVAMGLAVLARAEADGHRVEGLLSYFIKAWNELSNITPKDTHLISIHGSIKRLDANPGNSSHPIIVNRNILRGFNNKIKTAMDAIPSECEKTTGSPAHLHDFLAHETAMLCVTSLIFNTLQYLGVLDNTLSYQIATRPGCVIPESAERMQTHKVVNAIEIEIMDGADNYGLLQACPSLVVEIAIPTMKSSWVKMINALLDRKLPEIEELRIEAYQTPIEDLIAKLAEDEVYYSPSVIIAAEPAMRQSHKPSDVARLTLFPTAESSRAMGDIYTKSVRTVGSKFTRALSVDQPKHVVAATAIRSLVWSRLKNESMPALAKILYNDPDANLDVIKRCASTDFWRGAVGEVARVKAGLDLSSTVMAAFRSLGVQGIHIAGSDDVAEVTQSVASFFGAHLKTVTNIVADMISSLAGRSAKAFDKPFSERIVSNNPSVLNAKIKKEHLTKLVASNIETYKARIKALEEGKPTHRGDMKVSKTEGDSHSRVVDLRCRMYVYNSVEVKDNGDGYFNESKFAKIIRGASVRVAERLKVDPADLPAEVHSFEDTLAYMVDCNTVYMRAPDGRNSGWNPYFGQLGARMAYETFMMDAKMVMNTKFAVSAAEIAPRIHKKVIHTPLDVPEVPSTTVAPVTFSIFGGLSEGISLEDADEDELMAMMGFRAPKVTLPYWQLLYTLLISGGYSIITANERLGTVIDSRASASSLREAHLEDFTNSDIEKAFPHVVPDYMANGVVFDPSWLDRDEADAYTTDEMHSVPGGFLF